MRSCICVLASCICVLASCICVLVVSILPLSTFLIFEFGIVQTVWYFFVFYINVYKKYMTEHYRNISKLISMYPPNDLRYIYVRQTNLGDILCLFRFLLFFFFFLSFFISFFRQTFIRHISRRPLNGNQWNWTVMLSTMSRLLSEFSKWPPLPWKRPKC
jgi:hypothetical protein